MKRISIYVVVGLFLGITLMGTENVRGTNPSRGKNFTATNARFAMASKGMEMDRRPVHSALSQPISLIPSSGREMLIKRSRIPLRTAMDGMMPAFDLKPDEIKDIINYLRHTFKPT
jgi:hypothetical protein